MNIEKEAIRKQLQDWRHGLSDQFVAEASQKITEGCIELIDWKTVKVLHTYLPNYRQHEISTWPLLQVIWDTYPHISTAAPVVIENTIESRIITSATNMQESSFGIPKPLNAQPLDHRSISVVIVPVTGFAKAGYRLGYGPGHYDRFLAQLQQVMTIGLAYDETEADFPVENHDVPLNYIVTEQRIIHARS